MAEPANRRDLPGGGKFYLHPTTEETFDSVTTVLDTWDKDGLKIWAAGLSAEFAFDLMPQIMAAMALPECGNAYNRCYQKHGNEARCERCPCGECTQCLFRRVKFRHHAESSRRAQEGTEFHEAVNHWVLYGGDRLHLRDEVKPYFDTFLRFVDEFKLAPRTGGNPGSWEQTEATLLNREHMYAGTSDAAIWLHAAASPTAFEICDRLGADPALVRVDYKTREKPDEQLYNDMVMQGVAYENCPTILLPNGDELPAPKTHGRAVLQVRPDSYTFKGMKSGAGEFQVFLSLLTAYRWLRAHGNKSAFGWHHYNPPEPPPIVEHVVVPATEDTPPAPKKAPRKTAAKKAASATAKTEVFELTSGRHPAGTPVTQALTAEIPF